MRAAIVALLVLLSACAPPRQVTRVTDRPVPSATGSREAEASTATPIAPGAASTVKAGRFDGGKMWTFDDPPLAWFEEAYGLRPDSSWFARARGAALRFADYCSASFVSPHGLVMTNHHCGRESVSKVGSRDEALLDHGFYAASLAEERRVKDLFVEQLVGIRDITADVYSATAAARTNMERAEARRNRAEALAKRLTSEAKATDSTLTVQVIALYDGGRYAAYTFRRYDDVRLVQAPELQIGFFGGDWDNFTYPRYNLDMSFFRVYGKDGKPVRPEYWFPVDPTGADEGEAVFVVGNPGSTSRLATVSQLEYDRDVELPLVLEVLERRSAILSGFIESSPDTAEAYDLRNTWFSLQNSIKSTRGQLEGLRSDWLIPRRAAAEESLQKAILSVDSLRGQFGSVFDDIRAIDGSKRASAGQAAAFTAFGSPDVSSHVLLRALYGYVVTLLGQRGAPESQLEEIREEAREIEDRPDEIERAFLATRLEELRGALGENDPTVKSLFAGRSADSIAAAVITRTALTDSAAFVALLDGSYLSSGDATVPLIEAVAPLYFTLSQQLQNFEQQEEELNARLARARFALHGTSIPPDASFSLRIADGIVGGYPYNGTQAPPFTTFFGMYERHHALGDHPDWKLPDRWAGPPRDLNLGTPMNLVSTNDIAGGNSGSPLLDRELRVVGLVFDSNIEALPSEYLFTDERGRSISVDIRGILESLDVLYDADRIVSELVDHELHETEAEADEYRANR
jgi:hypothetical protein